MLYRAEERAFCAANMVSTNMYKQRPRKRRRLVRVCGTHRAHPAGLEEASNWMNNSKRALTHLDA